MLTLLVLWERKLSSQNKVWQCAMWQKIYWTWNLKIGVEIIFSFCDVFDIPTYGLGAEFYHVEQTTAWHTVFAYVEVNLLSFVQIL